MKLKGNEAVQESLFESDMTKPLSQQQKTSKTSKTSKDFVVESDFSSYLEQTNAFILSKNDSPLVDKQAIKYPFIFYKGDSSLLKRPSISVVGTRNPSSQGLQRTAQAVQILCDKKIVVMSGLAKGIDTAAHEKALRLNGKTIAVMGTPIHKIYPAQNKSLARQIEQEGLVLSSALPNQETGAYLFPKRNKLMAMLSKATLVIEAGEKSGVKHQANECLKENRQLILLQSFVDQKISWATNLLSHPNTTVVKNNDDLSNFISEFI